MRDAIERPSEAIRGHHGKLDEHLGHLMKKAIRGSQDIGTESHSESLRVTQSHSESLRGTHRHSQALNRANVTSRHTASVE